MRQGYQAVTLNQLAKAYLYIIVAKDSQSLGLWD
jgi:hypothetical protein